MVQNKGLVLAKYPDGWPVAGQDLVVETREQSLDQSAVPAGGLITKNYYVSFDPYQRGRMRKPDVASYVEGFRLGKPITNRGIARVVATDTDKFKVGDVIISEGCGNEEYTVLEAGAAARAFPLDNPLGLDPVNFIGALGMPGLTAWSSLYEIGVPKAGDTIFVSGAAGAVGQIVGQIAKHEKMKVIGSVGDDAKLDWIINDLGFDGGFNYKKEKPLEALKRLLPEGIDIYYDNVGGEQLEAAITFMKPFGRIVSCGMISQYNAKPGEAYGIRNLANVVGKRLKMQGFIVSDANMGPKYRDEHREKLSQWIKDGTFKVKTHITDGIENGPDGFIGMLAGKNFGKAVLKIADLEADTK